jgi:hypothetical protein
MLRRQESSISSKSTEAGQVKKIDLRRIIYKIASRRHFFDIGHQCRSRFKKLQERVPSLRALHNQIGSDFRSAPDLHSSGGAVQTGIDMDKVPRRSVTESAAATQRVSVVRTARPSWANPKKLRVCTQGE